MADELDALARAAATQLVEVMAGDSWDRVKHQFTWATHGRERQIRVSRATLAHAIRASRDQVISTEVSAWETRLRDALDEDPKLPAALRAILVASAGKAAASVAQPAGPDHTSHTGSSPRRVSAWLSAIWKRVKGRTKEQWLGIVAVATTLSYAFLYFGYFQFYAAFGLHPAEVGFDRLHLLQESLLGPLVLPIILVFHIPMRVWLTISAVLALLLTWVFIHYKMRRKFMIGDAARELLATVILAVLAGWAALTIYGYSNLVTMSRSLGGQVRTHGKLIDSWVYYAPRSIIIPFLDVQAVPADVTFTSNDAPQPILTAGCVLYLGASGGIVVLYDLKTEEVVRVNATDVDLNTHPNVAHFNGGYLPPSCMTESP